MTKAKIGATVDPSEPLLFADVVRELRRISAIAEEAGDPRVRNAGRHADRLLHRLRRQFLADVADVDT